MSNVALLLSIRPEYARKIFDGTKTVELRRTCPRVTKGDLVLVYASSPVKALVGAFKVDCILALSPQDLWIKVNSQAGITREEFNTYYAGVSIGYGIFISEVWSFPKPIKLSRLREWWPGFQPPQGYRYLVEGEANADLLIALIEGQEETEVQKVSCKLFPQQSGYVGKIGMVSIGPTCLSFRQQ